MINNRVIRNPNIGTRRSTLIVRTFINFSIKREGKTGNAGRFNPNSNPHIGANMSQENVFHATAMNVQSAQTIDVAGGYMFNSTSMDSYGMPATRVNLVEFGVTSDGSPKVSNSSPLVSPTTINVPRELSINVAATFGVPLTTVGDLYKLINDIKVGKHDELLFGMTNNDRMETMYALGTICNSIQATNNNAAVIPCKVSHVDDSINLNVDESTIPSDPILSKRIRLNSKSFFFFKFDSRASLEVVLKGGPWLICKSPIILKKWLMDTRLLKEELTHIPIWVKLHDVPIQVFEEDVISLIATFIGKPVMIDSYTSSMCNELWGQSSFTWFLIEVNSKTDLVDVVTIGIPSLSWDDFIKETIRVEYEWRPPRCDKCKIIGHVHDHCPKKVVSPPIITISNVVTPTVEKTNDGFQMVGKKKKRKGKSKSTNGGQFASPLVKQNVRYEPKVTTSAPKKGVTNVGNTSQSSSMLKTTVNYSKKDNLFMSNSFSALNDEEEDDKEDVYDESANLIQNIKAGKSLSFTAAVG
ncbi:zinc knuckle CX2CX4HX4C containing protein [Tanacetum coccineum]